MSNKRSYWEVATDLIIPIGAMLVFFFSLGSIFFFDGGLHLSSAPKPHLMKAYRKDSAAAVPRAQ